jgi:hypothetical protein
MTQSEAWTAVGRALAIAGLLVASCQRQPAYAHPFTAEECNAGAGVVGDIVRYRDRGEPPEAAYAYLGALAAQAKGTPHELDAVDLAVFRGYVQIAYLHPHMSRDDAWLQFYTACKAKLGAAE